ncbi:hypothetical protein [Ethanoligenens sp.]|uniref:hypothetical protein n=1 Tax=Ethanoligenens sp. TaxID=2099655 RepID=UPI0039EA5A06
MNSKEQLPMIEFKRMHYTLNELKWKGGGSAALAAESNSHDAEKVRLRQLEEENRQLRKDKADMEDTVEILKK